MSPPSHVYRPDIDGLRGLAVLAVVFYHAEMGLSGGFIGVDIFFVISGFLITGLIAKKVDSGDFRLREFWVRRIRRIFPAAFVMTSVVLIAGLLVMTPADLDQAASSAFCHQLFVSNVYFYFVSGYFAAPAETMPLLHTWSLSVEEQFYLVLPILLPFCLKVGRRFTANALLAVTVISFVASVSISASHSSAAFFLIPTRAWELSVGGLLAVQKTDIRSRRWCEWIGWGSVFGLFYSAMYFDQSLPFPSYYAALPVLCCVLLIDVARNESTSIHRALAVKPLVFVGLVSYSFYLWHWPVFAFAKYLLGESDLWFRLLLLALSFLLAVVSWKWIENPIRYSKRISSTRTFVGFAVAACLLTGTSLFIAKSAGLPSRMSDETNAAIANLEIAHQHLAVSLSDVTEGRLPIIGDQDQAPSFLLWGDSHALAASEVVSRHAATHQVSGYIAGSGGHPPLLGVEFPKTGINLVGDLPRWNESVMGLVIDKKIPNVILVAAWTSYGDDRLGERSDRGLLVDQGLLRTISKLQEHQVRVWVFRQPPNQHYNVGKQYLNQKMFGWPKELTAGITADEYVESRRPCDSIFDTVRSRGVVVLDPVNGCFTVEGVAQLVVDGQVLYVDDNHLTSAGVQQFFGELIDEVFTQIGHF